MQIDRLSISDLPIVSSLVKDYLKGKLEDTPLMAAAPKLSHFKDIIAKKQMDSASRSMLVDALKEQYASRHLSSKVTKNIDLLQEETCYTVTAAHQLCLFTGPLYFIYKIMSAIKLCEILKAEFPKNNFVPVYWMGSEDHDFAEINHLHVYGKTITWEKEATGAVGRLDGEYLAEGIDSLADILKDQGKALIDELRSSFINSNAYGKNFQGFITNLFEDYGLVVLNQDDQSLKGLFRHEMQMEMERSIVATSVPKALEYLEANYHVQALPREVNLFYLKDDLRERIDKDDEGFVVNNSSLRFTKEELISELLENPDRFSPNVNLRPMYQEKILPNVAFIGGPGEIAYWLPLKEAFTAMNITFPALVLRDMALHLDKGIVKKMQQYELTMMDLFSDKDALVKDVVAKNAEQVLELGDEKAALVSIFAKVLTKAVAIDKNMDKAVAAEQQKALNALENLESKLIRAEKKNQEQLVNSLQSIKEKLFPHGSFQERYNNFIPLYLKYGKEWFKELHKAFNPLEGQLKVLREEATT